MAPFNAWFTLSAIETVEATFRADNLGLLSGGGFSVQWRPLPVSGPGSEKFLAALKGNYSIWPAAQAINLWFLPAEWQLVWIQCVALIWNVYLSWCAV